MKHLYGRVLISRRLPLRPIGCIYSENQGSQNEIQTGVLFCGSSSHRRILSSKSSLIAQRSHWTEAHRPTRSQHHWRSRTYAEEEAAYDTRQREGAYDADASPD